MALPLLAALFAGFSLVAISLLQVGEYRPLLVLPLVLAGVAAWAVGLTRPEALAGPRAGRRGAAARRRFALLNVRYSA